MKTHPSRRQDGFTLVELLVVIAIIAVLAGAGFAAGNAAIQKARRTTALADIVALEGAVNKFYSEYGAMPTTESTTGEADATEIDTDSTEGRELLNILLGLDEEEDPPLNTRGIKFLEIKEGKGDRGGIIYEADGKSVKGLYDPWGGSYKIVLDTGFDERVQPKPKGGGGPTNPLNGRRSAAWSDGADGVDSTGKATDDVKNW